MRLDLCAEGIRLARVLTDLMPDEPEAQGLLALLLLLHARRAARVTADGSLVRLAEQDRRLWDRSLIAEGQAIVRACVQVGRPGPYQIQAARLGHTTEAAAAYASARTLTTNPAEQTFLDTQRAGGIRTGKV